jgi:hypothetical protein
MIDATVRPSSVLPAMSKMSPAFELGSVYEKPLLTYFQYIVTV